MSRDKDPPTWLKIVGSVITAVMVIALSVAFFGSIYSCGADSNRIEDGKERGPCYSKERSAELGVKCNVGLQCLSNVCVRAE